MFLGLPPRFTSCIPVVPTRRILKPLHTQIAQSSEDCKLVLVWLDFLWSYLSWHLNVWYSHIWCQQVACAQCRYLAYGTSMDYMYERLHIPYPLTFEVITVAVFSLTT